MPEYDIMCKHCENCLVDPKHPANANLESPQNGNCTYYIDKSGNPLAAQMGVSFKQCPGAKRGHFKTVKAMPESGPPRSDESREEKIERLKAELHDAENYDPDPAPVKEALPIDEEKEMLKKKIAELLKKSKPKPKAKKKTGQSRKKAVKK